VFLVTARTTPKALRIESLLTTTAQGLVSSSACRCQSSRCVEQKQQTCWWHLIRGKRFLDLAPVENVPSVSVPFVLWNMVRLDVVKPLQLVSECIEETTKPCGFECVAITLAHALVGGESPRFL